MNVKSYSCTHLLLTKPNTPLINQGIIKTLKATMTVLYEVSDHPKAQMQAWSKL